METVSWTDEKIDLLDKMVDKLDSKVDAVETKVHDGFARAEVEYTRTDERFKRVGERFDQVDRDMAGLKGDIQRVDDKLDAKFDGLQRTIMQVGGGLIGTLIAGIVT